MRPCNRRWRIPTYHARSLALLSEVCDREPPMSHTRQLTCTGGRAGLPFTPDFLQFTVKNLHFAGIELTF